MDTKQLTHLLPRSCNAYNSDGYGCYALPIWAIGVIAAGCGLFLIIAITVFFCCKIGRRRKREKKAVEEELAMGNDVNPGRAMGTRDVMQYQGEAARKEAMPWNPDAY